MIGQSSDGAVAARVHQGLQRALHPIELVDLLIDLADLFVRDRANAAAVAPGLAAQLQQFLHFVEREPQVLGALDEANDPHGLVGELAVAGGAARRLREQPAAFVVAQRLDVHPRLFRRFTDPHRQPLLQV